MREPQYNDLVQIYYNPQLKYKGYVDSWNEKTITIRNLYDNTLHSHFWKACDVYLINKKNTIYLITNIVNGKQYIGRTIGTIEDRFISHWRESRRPSSQTPLHIDMQKYGIDSFKIEKLYEFEADRQQIANITEQEFIKKYNTKIPNGYNVV